MVKSAKDMPVADQVILVVEDDSVQRRQIARALISSGYLVSLAASGEEAIEILAETAVGIVLTDRRMPGMDGIELLERIKEEYPKVLVGMITAYPGEGSDFFPDALLSKPFGHRELLDLVKSLEQKTQPSLDS
ncbi:MAG: response regulator [Candidatus Abyssobacteria bacterium SURF_5]|uniref:Response regulator n=1 Tax=Abyssobacteria bacterium (strain SURF_5) TaxID=2093360 RepID=A0A3A4P5B3_ABYX5|nr:MAG: response regulator [Candidatus Abyssubacteria bacterium SURF_5]